MMGGKKKLIAKWSRRHKSTWETMFRHHDDDKSLHFFFCDGQTTPFMIKNEFKKKSREILETCFYIDPGHQGIENWKSFERVFK